MLLAVSPLRADLQNPDTDWMSGEYGLGFHYLRGNIKGQDSDWNTTVESFNTQKFADSVAATGAKWVLFTLGQNSGYYCSPNRTLDSISGYKPGERNSIRDLPLDIMNALAPKGIRTMLYLPSSVPNGDSKIATAFGLSQKEPGGSNYMITPQFMLKWAMVIREWSMRYGTKLSGWWFDGYYRRVGFTDSLGVIYRDAVKSGNAKSLISLCGGIRDSEELRGISRWSDYLSGEQNDGTWIPKSRWYTGNDGIGPVQWHSFCQFTPGWWQEGNRYTDDEYVTYANAVYKNGGGISWNCFVYADGTMSPAVLAQLKRTKPRIITNPLKTTLFRYTPAARMKPGSTMSWRVFIYPEAGMSTGSPMFNSLGRKLPANALAIQSDMNIIIKESAKLDDR
jgi:hypothetical protein